MAIGVGGRLHEAERDANCVNATDPASEERKTVFHGKLM